MKTSPPLIIFLHIPKTGGETLHSILGRKYRDDNIFSVEIDTVDASEDVSLEKFRNLDDAEKKKIALIEGHMRFGIHKDCPGPSRYITLLRDPVDRLISLYYYILEVPYHYLYKNIIAGKMNLRDFVASGLTTETDNHQVRLISGMDNIENGKCNTEMLQAAMKNIDNEFEVAGITEMYDESLILMKKTFGWSLPVYSRINATRNKPRKRDMSAATLELITRHNEYDIQLYEYVKKRLMEKIEAQDGSFRRDLKLLRLGNSINKKIHLVK